MSTTTAIDRNFTEGDASRFAELTNGLLGQPCVAWRKSYGRTGSLHFGMLVPRRAVPEKAVHDHHGLWIVDLWDCDRRISLGANETLDSRSGGDETVIVRIAELKDKIIEGVQIDPKTLSLNLAFSGGALLTLITDPASSATDEQWAIQLPDGRAVIIYGQRRWALEVPPSSG